MNKLFNIYFSFQGKMRRKEYWFALIPIIIIANILGYYLGKEYAYMDAYPLSESNSSMGLSLMLIFVLSVFLVVGKLFIAAKRCADMGISKFWGLVVVIPFIGDIFALIIGLIPSKESA